jgi:tRNA 2-selenouridine synthase
MVDGWLQGLSNPRRVADLRFHALAARFDYQVICGTTGSGKTDCCEALAACGVLDLEALANHRSSVLGMIRVAQPTRRHSTVASGPSSKF